MQTRGHLFVRWDGGGERFNIETTGAGGTDSFADEHYRTWPERWQPGEPGPERYLLSLSAAEELAL